MSMNLESARVNANLSRKEVCEKLEIHPNTLANYESYKTKPDIDTAVALANLYGCSLNDIRWDEK